MKDKKIVIAVGGPSGSGKTTYARYIAKKLGLPHVSAGSLFRKLAKERGMTLVELNKEAETNPVIDYLIDKMSLDEAKKGNVVLEGHLTPWVVKDYADLMIYVNAPINVRVKRIAEREGRDWKEVLTETAKRELSHAIRFKKLYGLDLTDLSIFDYVIDTEKIGVEGVQEIIDTILNTRFKNSLLEKDNE